MSKKLVKCAAWLSESEAQYLDALARDGGLRNRSQLIRLLLQSIIEDDRKAQERAA